MLINVNEARRLLLIEKECINRECDRNCAECDIVQTEEDLNAAYDIAIKAVEKQIEMKEFCSNTICSVCPYKDPFTNKCMNDFIV